ncbi:MAG TPA: hypothetical protein VFD84_13160 [Candidatus Binatia bacterium]|nr:hypothetical protein [Candidatus Binatia bacterium]
MDAEPRRAEPRHPHAVPPSAVAALLPPAFFAVAVAFFATGTVATPFLVGDLAAYFYQARVLALTHVLTLGWISMVILGVLYRYVPGLTKQRVPAPRVALAQWATFVAGVAALVTQLWLGSWTRTAAAAALLLVSAGLACANFWPMLWRAPSRGVAEVGIAIGTGFLTLAAALGTLLALDKQHPLLGGSTLTNLAAHAHLAALGWVGVMICALSFRFLPAFLLPTVEVPSAARAQVIALAAAVVLLAAALLVRSALVPLAALAIAAALVAYLVLLVRVVRSHRLPIDWTARHALASAVWLLGATAGGVCLGWTGAQSALGARLAAAYGVAGLLGWMSNLVIGMSYKLFPGFVLAARTHRRRPPAPLAALEVPGPVKPIVFGAFNLGVAGTVATLLAGTPLLAVAATATTAFGAVLYAAATARTLAFTVVDPRVRTALAVLA